MEYLLVVGGAVAAGALPLAAYMAFRITKSRRRHKEGQRRRAKKIQL
jgi:hypothetical protein